MTSEPSHIDVLREPTTSRVIPHGVCRRVSTIIELSSYEAQERRASSGSGNRDLDTNNELRKVKGSVDVLGDEVNRYIITITLRDQGAKCVGN